MRVDQYLALATFAGKNGLVDSAGRISTAKLKILFADYLSLQEKLPIRLKDNVKVKGQRALFQVIGFIPSIDSDNRISFDDVELMNSDGEYLQAPVEKVSKV